MKVLPVLDVSAFQVPQRFILAIAAQCAAEAENTKALGIATPFETEEGQALLAETAAHYWPEINELAGLVRDMVAHDPACVVLRGLGYNWRRTWSRRPMFWRSKPTSCTARSSSSSIPCAP